MADEAEPVPGVVRRETVRTRLLFGFDAARGVAHAVHFPVFLGRTICLPTVKVVGAGDDL